MNFKRRENPELFTWVDKAQSWFRRFFMKIRIRLFGLEVAGVPIYCFVDRICGHCVRFFEKGSEVKIIITGVTRQTMDLVINGKAYRVLFPLVSQQDILLLLH